MIDEQKLINQLNILIETFESLEHHHEYGKGISDGRVDAYKHVIELIQQGKNK